MPPKLQSITNLPLETLLVTVDFRSLYTNIPHSEGIEACRAALNTREVLHLPQRFSTVRLIDLILTKNRFAFVGEYYLQKHGTAI